MEPISRRNLFKGAAAAASLIGVSAVAGREIEQRMHESITFPFDGKYQAGIATPIQQHAQYLAFDLSSDSKNDVIDLLKSWTVTSRELTSTTLQSKSESYDAPPSDTGESLDAAPEGLTITFGFGSSLFVNAEGKDRFGIDKRRPKELQELPGLPRDAIDPNKSCGDILIQVCGNNPTRVFHAARNLTRNSFGAATVRWAQEGFSGATSLTDKGTPRNLFGFKDGSVNPHTSADLAENVWVASASEPAWFQNGTYLAMRNIRMNIETWDRSSLREQENTLGRTKGTGAPLSGGDEFTAPDFSMADGSGGKIIPADSHLAIAHSSNFKGNQMLRRGFNYQNGFDSVGHIDAGLMFVAFQQSVAENFTPVLQALGRSDALNEYISHIGTGIYAVPPGVSSSGFIGDGLFS